MNEQMVLSYLQSMLTEPQLPGSDRAVPQHRVSVLIVIIPERKCGLYSAKMIFVQTEN